MQLQNYVQIQHMARKRSQPISPSFARSIDAKVRQQEYASRILGVETFSHFARRRGVAAEFVRSLGYQTPTVVADGFQLRYFPRLVGELDQFVIKPVHATNSWGVATLVRVDERHWTEVSSGNILDFGQLLESLNAPMHKYGFPDKWQLEELLLPVGGTLAPLADYKFYAFQGEIGLILQTLGRGEQRRYKWYDAQWEAIATGKYEDRIDETLAGPDDATSLLNAAREISASIPVPFCRIDLYETSGGVYVGELTPEPGGYHEFHPDIDEMLGAMYEQAQAKLAAAGPANPAVAL